MAPAIRHTEHIGIRVRDLEASLRFYHDLLGLPIAERRTMPSGTELVFLAIGSAGYVELIGRPPGTEAGPAGAGAAAAQSASRPADQAGGGNRGGAGAAAGLHHFAILVDDLDAWIEHIKAQGIPFTVQPFRFELSRERCRAFFIADPDGTPVEIFERRPKE
jgi:catechol 2,3-dioxygenase-like lactoylglutathione lyase family enzyme